MSIALMTVAWRDPRYSGSELLLLLALADHANDDGECFPSQATLAEKTRLSERQVRRLIQKFESDHTLEIVTWQEGRKRRNRYELTIGHLVRSSDSTTGHIEPPRPDTAMSDESSREPSEDLLAAAPRVGHRNMIWDVLVEVCGAPTTRSETSDFGKTVSELRAAIPKEATFEQITEAVSGRKARWGIRYPDAAFTHRVLRQHWSALGQPQHGGQPSRPADYETDSFGRELEGGTF